MNFCSIDCSSNLIDITGLCNPSDVVEVISLNPYWMQMNISEKLEIPQQKPDVEQVNSLNISVNIIRKEVVRTPVSPTDTNGNYIPNLEGKISTGRKLIIEGELCQKIVYTAEDEVQSVHSAHFYVPFSSYIVVPLNINFGNDTTPIIVDSLNIDYQVNSCVEDVVVKMLDPRTILKEVTLLLYAVPNQTF